MPIWGKAVTPTPAGNLPGNRDSIVDSVAQLGAIASIIALPIGIVGLAIIYGAKEWYLQLLNAGLIVALCFLIFSYNRKHRRLASIKEEIVVERSAKNRAEELLTRTITDFREIAKLIDSISTERALITRYLFNVRSGIEPYNSDKLDAQVKSFARKLVNCAKELFAIHTHESCACCIKFIGQTDAHRQSIVGTLRDDVSTGHRRDTDATLGTYEYQANYAFRNIMSAYHNRPSFVCNDLQSFPGYDNANKNWRETYNATAVVPLMKPGSYSREDVIGFLCVDNLVGAFDEQFSANILRSCSHMIYNILTEQQEIAKALPSAIALETSHAG